MNRKLTIGIKKKLRDPIWQSIGVFIAFITLITSLFVGNLLFRPHPPMPNRLIFSSDTSKDLIDFPESVSKRTQIMIDSKEERNLRLFIFRLEYRGEQPVRSADFEAPIKGKIPNSRKLVSVQKSANLQGPTRFNKETGMLTRDQHPPIDFEVELLDQHTFEIKPLLMNPGEWLGIEIYTAAAENSNYTPPIDSGEKYKELSSEITWTCHVAGVECPGSLDLNRDFEYMGFDEPSFLQVYVIHQGWSVYFILLFTVVNLIVLVMLAKNTHLQKTSAGIQLVLFALAIALSEASGEVAADWLLPYRFFGIELNFGQPFYAYIIFWLNIFVLIVLAAVSIWQRRKNRRVRVQKLPS